jgi:hypothetical protein
MSLWLSEKKATSAPETKYEIVIKNIRTNTRIVVACVVIAAGVVI